MSVLVFITTYFNINFNNTIEYALHIKFKTTQYKMEYKYIELNLFMGFRHLSLRPKRERKYVSIY